MGIKFEPSSVEKFQEWVEHELIPKGSHFGGKPTFRCERINNSNDHSSWMDKVCLYETNRNDGMEDTAERELEWKRSLGGEKFNSSLSFERIFFVKSEFSLTISLSITLSILSLFPLSLPSHSILSDHITLIQCITLITFKWKRWSFVCQLRINQTIISMQNSFLLPSLLDPGPWIKFLSCCASVTFTRFPNPLSLSYRTTVLLSAVSTVKILLFRHSKRIPPKLSHISFSELMTWIIEAKLTTTTLFRLFSFFFPFCPLPLSLYLITMFVQRTSSFVQYESTLSITLTWTNTLLSISDLSIFTFFSPSCCYLLRVHFFLSLENENFPPR